MVVVVMVAMAGLCWWWWLCLGVVWAYLLGSILDKYPSKLHFADGLGSRPRALLTFTTCGDTAAYVTEDDQTPRRTCGRSSCS